MSNSPGLGCAENQKSVHIWFKNRTVQKFDICSDSFPTEIAYNRQCQTKSDKNSFTCRTIIGPKRQADVLSAPYGTVTLCAFNVQIKNMSGNGHSCMLCTNTSTNESPAKEN